MSSTILSLEIEDFKSPKLILDELGGSALLHPDKLLLVRVVEPVRRIAGASDASESSIFHLNLKISRHPKPSRLDRTPPSRAAQTIANSVLASMTQAIYTCSRLDIHGRFFLRENADFAFLFIEKVG